MRWSERCCARCLAVLACHS